MSTRTSLVCVSAVWGAFVFAIANGQAPPMPNAFRHGMSYEFNATSATRAVDDAHDHGEISLTVYIWKPRHTNSSSIVLLNHGSTGGGSIHPKEPVEWLPRALLKFFVDRGYTVVVPIRRGVGPSTGAFIAECAFQSGECSLADNRALAIPALDDAVRDVAAVLDQVVFGKLVPADSKILFAGISRGGFLSLRMAAERPRNTAGVLNFVGGWISLSDAWPAEENAARLALHQGQLRQIARQARAVPTLWIYGNRDPFYASKDTRAMFETFIEAGGKGSYFFVSDHALPTGHSIAQSPELWERSAAPFLASLQGGP